MANLLMLDDDRQTLEWTSAALESRGHTVRCFTSAREALEALATYAPDLIVSDILMPELDGLAFARLVRRHRQVPVMFVSIAKKQAEAVLAGAVGYVQKPATAAEMREAVERVLGERARRSSILIVDDDPDVRSLYTLYLEPRFTVLTAENGAEALEVLKSRRVDLAIVDVHMPVMNGVELIKNMRSDPGLEALPIIVQTTDRSALQAPIWGSLRVSKVMDKVSFLDWFEGIINGVGAGAAGELGL